MFINLLDYDPIPLELLETDMEKILTLPDHSPHPTYALFRQHRIVDKLLLDHIQQHFDFDVTLRSFYQIIKDGLLVHIDMNRTIIHNYVIAAGGDDVYTVWYDEDKITERYRFKIPERKWHQLDVTTNHTVVGISDTRLAITVFELST